GPAARRASSPAPPGAGERGTPDWARPYGNPPRTPPPAPREGAGGRPPVPHEVGRPSPSGPGSPTRQRGGKALPLAAPCPLAGASGCLALFHAPSPNPPNGAARPLRPCLPAAQG